VCHCGSVCCGVHGRIADGVRAMRTVGAHRRLFTDGHGQGPRGCGCRKSRHAVDLVFSPGPGRASLASGCAGATLRHIDTIFCIAPSSCVRSARISASLARSDQASRASQPNTRSTAR